MSKADSQAYDQDNKLNMHSPMKFEHVRKLLERFGARVCSTLWSGDDSAEHMLHDPSGSLKSWQNYTRTARAKIRWALSGYIKVGYALKDKTIFNSILTSTATLNENNTLTTPISILPCTPPSSNLLLSWVLHSFHLLQPSTTASVRIT